MEDITNVNIRGLNLNLLPVLDALLAERHVSRAARRLGLSQPAVSNALAQLRARLGDPLLVRGPGGMVPTERALALRAPVQSMLSALDGALATPAPFHPTTCERTFTVWTTDLVELVLMPRLIARLLRLAPGIKLRLRAWPFHRVPPELERGQADLMIGLAFVSGIPAGHRLQPLFHDHFTCIVRRQHPQVRRRLTLETYVKLSHILVSGEDEGPGVVDTALAVRGLTRVVGLRLSHFLLVPHVIAATDMVAALSSRVAQPMSRLLPIRLLPPPLPLPGGTIGQIWHERTHASPAHVWLRKIVADTARGLPGGPPLSGSGCERSARPDRPAQRHRGAPPRRARAPRAQASPKNPRP